MEGPSWLWWIALIAGILYLLKGFGIGALGFMDSIDGVGLLMIVLGLAAVLGGK